MNIYIYWRRPTESRGEGEGGGENEGGVARPQLRVLPRHCEDRVLDGPASGKKAPRVGPFKNCNPRT